jgi:hypothetical protein
MIYYKAIAHGFFLVILSLHQGLAGFIIGIFDARRIEFHMISAA